MADQGDMPVHRKVRNRTLFFYLLESKISAFWSLWFPQDNLPAKDLHISRSRFMGRRAKRSLILFCASMSRCNTRLPHHLIQRLMESLSATPSHHEHMPFFAIVVVLCLWLDCCIEANSKIFDFSLCCSEYALLSYFRASLLPKWFWSSIIFI